MAVAEVMLSVALEKTLAELVVPGPVPLMSDPVVAVEAYLLQLPELGHRDLAFA